MLFREIIAVYCENHTKDANILRGQNVMFLNFKSGGTYSYQCALSDDLAIYVRVSQAILDRNNVAAETEGSVWLAIS
jgi:hypothetical protein